MATPVTAQPTREQLLERIAELEAASNRGNGLKVSPKGAVSLYGLMRFPVTLYPESWFKVFDLVSTIQAFIKANHAKLSWKNGDPYAPAAAAVVPTVKN